MTKKPCVNSSEWTYTGKEVSPTGLGYAPDGESEGTQMKGRDETMWIVGRKNGVKVWNRVPTVLIKEDPVIVHETSKKDVEENPQDEKEDEDEAKDEAEDEDEAKVDEEEVKPPPAPIVPKTEPEKKKRAPAKKKAAVAVVPEAPAEAVPEAPAEAVPEAPAVVVPEAPAAAVPEKKKRAPAKKKVDAEVNGVPETPAAVPEKKKRAPAKKKTGGEEVKEVKSDFHIYLVDRLKTITGATHKERFGAAAKEWGAMTDDEKNAAVADLKVNLK